MEAVTASAAPPTSGTGVPWLRDGTYMRLSIVGGRSDDKSQDKVSVEIYGLKGEERVIGVYREIFFYAGGQPLIDKTKEQLVAKYGALEPIAPPNMGSGLAEEIGIARDRNQRYCPSRPRSGKVSSQFVPD